MIANYFGTLVPSYGENKEGDEESASPRTFNSQFIKKQDMRYGENSHQAAAFYAEEQAAGLGKRHPAAGQGPPTTTLPTPMRRWSA